MKAQSPELFLKKIFFLLLLILFVSCSRDYLSNHYLLAEKFWLDGKYSAAVSEFEKVINKDPHGKLGLQATYRAAVIQFIFLSQFPEAIQNFKIYSREGTDSQHVLASQNHVGEILFSKLEQYDQVIVHYRDLLQKNHLDARTPEFLFRIAKSYFFLFRFSDSVSTYRDLIKKYPQSTWAERAGFEIGVSYFTSGERLVRLEAYREAMGAYEQFIQQYPNSYYVPEARFGVASCLEELDQMEEAMNVYLALRDVYPSESVIEMKVSRIKERLAQQRVGH